MPDFEEKYTINLSNLSICYRKAVMTKRKKKEKKEREREKRRGGEGENKQEIMEHLFFGATGERLLRTICIYHDCQTQLNFSVCTPAPESR